MNIAERLITLHLEICTSSEMGILPSTQSPCSSRRRLAACTGFAARQMLNHGVVALRIITALLISDCR